MAKPQSETKKGATTSCTVFAVSETLRFASQENLRRRTKKLPLSSIYQCVDTQRAARSKETEQQVGSLGTMMNVNAPSRGASARCTIKIGLRTRKAPLEQLDEIYPWRSEAFKPFPDRSPVWEVIKRLSRLLLGILENLEADPAHRLAVRHCRLDISLDIIRYH